MDRLHDDHPSYSWHQSHDQATVLLLVPYDTLEEDVHVVIERHHLVAGVRGQSPIVKGRLYRSVDTNNSVWQLEPHMSHLSARERTTSATSTASTHSSYAFVSDPEISSSFAASLENGLVSDSDDPVLSSPALSSPISGSVDEGGFAFLGPQRHPRFMVSSQNPSPSSQPPTSMTSSVSSVESLHTGAGRLLTLHLEKTESVIWPSLIVGPAPETLSPPVLSLYPWTSASSEFKYNMDPTSLVLIALDLYDIRNAYEEAFEYFVRAWHQGRVPSATMRLATHYLSVQTVFPEPMPTPSASPPPPQAALASSDHTVVGGSSHPTPGPAGEPSTPVPPSAVVPSFISAQPPGTSAYYLERIGGPQGLAQLFLAAGVLHLEGAAAPLLSSVYAGLSSLRAPGPGPGPTHSSTDAWRRDRGAARRFFERARALVPALDVPLLPPDADSDPDPDPDPDSGAESGGRRRAPAPPPEAAQPRRRRKKDSRELSSSFVDSLRSDAGEDDDDAWYLYIPGLVGAGAALLVVGFLSLSSWRKSQGS